MAAVYNRLILGEGNENRWTILQIVQAIYKIALQQQFQLW
jgi:hypothetical protein